MIYGFWCLQTSSYFLINVLIVAPGFKMKYGSQDIFSLPHSRLTTIHILNNTFLFLWPDNTLLWGEGAAGQVVTVYGGFI